MEPTWKFKAAWGSLGGLIRWSYGFQNCGWVWNGFGDWVDFVTRECEGLGGGGAGALRELMESNRSFPVMSTLRIVLAALEIFRHMLDFRSNMSCFGFG